MTKLLSYKNQYIFYLRGHQYQFSQILVNLHIVPHNGEIFGTGFFDEKKSVIISLPKTTQKMCRLLGMQERVETSRYNVLI